MASLVLGNPRASGPTLIISGNPWADQTSRLGTGFPTGGVQLLWLSSGGCCYIGLSGSEAPGGMTINSGAMLLSGAAASGMLDGFPIVPGGALFVPKASIPFSGVFNLWADCDVQASGVGRLHFLLL